jgi:hypothetical protein
MNLSKMRLRWMILFVSLIAFVPRVIFPLATSICYDEMAAKDSGKIWELIKAFDFRSSDWAHYPYFPFYKYVYGLLPQIFFGSVPSDPDDLAGPRFMGALIGSGIVVFTFLIGTRLFGKSIGLVGALLLAFTPSVLGHDRIAMHDAPSRLLAIASWYYIISWYQTGKFRAFAISALLAGLSVTFFHRTGLQSGLAIALWIAYVLLKKDIPWRSRLKFYSFYGVTSLGTFITTVFAFWPYLWFRPHEIVRWYADPSSTIGAPGSPEFWFGVIQPVPWHYYLVSLAISTPPIVLLAFLYSGYLNSRSNFKRPEFIALYLLVVIPLFLMSITLRQCLAHYLQIVFPALCLLAAHVLWSLLERIQRIKPVAELKNLGIIFVFFLQLYACASVNPYFMEYFNIFTGGGANVEKRKLFTLTTYGEAINPLFQYVREKSVTQQSVLCRLGAWPGLGHLPRYLGPNLFLQGYQVIDPRGPTYVLRVGAERDNVFYRYEPESELYIKVMDVYAGGASLGEVWQRREIIPGLIYVDDFSTPQFGHFVKGSENIQLNPFSNGKLFSNEYGKRSSVLMQFPSKLLQGSSSLSLLVDARMNQGKLEVSIGEDPQHLKNIIEIESEHASKTGSFDWKSNKDLFVQFHWISHYPWNGKPSTFWEADWIDSFRIYSKKQTE